MAPREFKPVTPQTNVLVATTTRHVCLCLHLYSKNIYYISPEAHLLPLHNV
jgi:hypothetical protein